MIKTTKITLTEKLQRYENIKSQNADHIAIFKTGSKEFYEVFHHDAQLVSQKLNIPLIKRKEGGSLAYYFFGKHEMTRLKKSNLKFQVYSYTQDKAHKFSPKSLSEQKKATRLIQLRQARKKELGNDLER